jgi:hypothetical protein
MNNGKMECLRSQWQWRSTRRVSTNRTDKQPILCSCDFFRMASTCQDISNLEGNCKGPVLKPLHKSWWPTPALKICFKTNSSLSSCSFSFHYSVYYMTQPTSSTHFSGDHENSWITLHNYCAASEPEASERSSILICAERWWFWSNVGPL